MHQKTEQPGTIAKVNETPELLAPAGNIEAGLAAFDHGADAVYAGLQRFNARERGRNLDMDGLSRLCAFAHKNSRRVYVTLNTLIKENELEELAGILAELTVIRPDALIIQDIGTIAMIRRWFPELVMHASTQTGIHNSAGARTAAAMGIRRIILERQTTYEEIREIRLNTDIELEVFVHGALCCGRSGACLFSSWMGGWSGNRGKCKQPCRRRYFSEQGNGFFFSPKDLYSLEHINELKKLGVKSLKIEGRLRAPDYVASVVSAYRLMLDTPDSEAKAALQEAKKKLSGAFSRKWHGPFRTTGDFQDIIQHDSLGTAGMACGKITGLDQNGFSVKLTRDLFLHDRIRIQPPSGDEGPAISVSTLFVAGRAVKRAAAGMTCFIRSDKTVEPGALVYKTGSQTAGINDRISRLPLERLAVDLEVTVDHDEVLINIPDTGTWTFKQEFQTALNRPVTSEAIAKEFAKSRSEKFRAGNIDVKLPENIFIPAADLKTVRREFWSRIDKEIDPDNITAGIRSRVTAVREHLGGKSGLKQIDPEKTVAGENIPGTVHARAPGAVVNNDEEIVLPDFCPEFRIKECVKSIEQALAKGVKRFRATSLYALDLLKNIPDIKISVSFSIPICNTLAVEQAAELGADKVMAWIELDKESIHKLTEKFGGRVEVFTYGRIPLFSTRMRIPAKNRISDGRGAGFVLENENGLTRVYPEKALSIPEPDNASVYIDLTHAEPGELETSSFNYDRDWP